MQTRYIQEECAETMEELSALRAGNCGGSAPSALARCLGSLGIRVGVGREGGREREAERDQREREREYEREGGSAGGFVTGVLSKPNGADAAFPDPCTGV